MVSQLQKTHNSSLSPPPAPQVCPPPTHPPPLSLPLLNSHFIPKTPRPPLIFQPQCLLLKPFQILPFKLEPNNEGTHLFMWPCHTACGILASWPGIEPWPTTLKAWSPNYWTSRGFPGHPFTCHLYTLDEGRIVSYSQRISQGYWRPSPFCKGIYHCHSNLWALFPDL